MSKTLTTAEKAALVAAEAEEDLGEMEELRRRAVKQALKHDVAPGTLAALIQAIVAIDAQYFTEQAAIEAEPSLEAELDRLMHLQQKIAMFSAPAVSIQTPVARQYEPDPPPEAAPSPRPAGRPLTDAELLAQSSHQTSTPSPRRTSIAPGDTAVEGDFQGQDSSGKVKVAFGGQRGA